MKELARILEEGHHSLVVRKGCTRTFDGRGVSDLHRLLHEEPEALDSAMVAESDGFRYTSSHWSEPTNTDGRPGF